MKAKKPAKRNSEVRFNFLAEEDKQKCEELAKNKGLKLASWIRTLVYEELSKQ